MRRKITPFTKLAALVAISFLALGLVAPAFATSSLLYSNPSANHNSDWVFGTSNGAAYGKEVTGNGNYLASATFQIDNNTAANSGDLTAALYNITGGEPPAGESPIESSSNSYSVDGLNGHTLVTFYFTNTSKLTFGTSYGVCITAVVALAQMIDACASASGGDFYRTDNTSAWATGSTAPIIYVYTESTYGGATPPSDDPGIADWTTYDQMIDSFVSFMVPLIVLLLPAVLLMFLTRRTDKWLLIIGIAIGAGLGYYFGMVPLWLVFLIVIGLIGMAYQSVRGGNS